MSKKGEAGKSKQFRWTKPMERMLLEILADEVKNGNKPNNVYRISSFTRVANAVNEQYGVECLSTQVEHHLRTLRSSWSIIEKLRLEKTGLRWDDSLKMIIASPSVYDEYVQANPSYEKYLNKKIEMFNEMALVVGKDRAKGNFAKSFGDINLERRPQLESISVDLDADIGLEEVPKEKDDGKQASSSSTTSSQSRQHCKRNRTTYTEDDSLAKISDRIGEVVVALGKLIEDRLVVGNLYEEVMKTEDFDEEFLASAFDYLVQNEMLARAFLAKN